jgi:hypothetical protein
MASRFERPKSLSPLTIAIERRGCDLDLDLDLSSPADDGIRKREETGHKNENIGDLRTAGVTRAELFERTASRQPIRVHDLRALFVTVNLANGKTAEWVVDRTGHRGLKSL